MRARILWAVFALTNYLPASAAVMMAVRSPELILATVLIPTPMALASNPLLILSSSALCAAALAIVLSPGSAGLAKRLQAESEGRSRAENALSALRIGLLTTHALLPVGGFFGLAFVRAGWSHHHGDPGIGVYLVPISLIVAPIANVALLWSAGLPLPFDLADYVRRRGGKGSSDGELQDSPHQRVSVQGTWGGRIAWALFSALGAAAGSAVSLSLFPQAAAGQYAGGAFRGPPAGFAIVLGAGLGIGQILASRLAGGVPGKGVGASRRALLDLLWLIASAIGMGMVLIPLWGIHLDRLLALPIIAPLLMLPGLTALGLLQGALKDDLGVSMGTWTRRTIIGGVLGIVLAPLAYVLLGAVSDSASLDVIGAGAIGLCIGGAQGGRAPTR